MPAATGWASEPEFTLRGDDGAVTFRVEKLLPMPGYRVLREIRTAIGASVGDVEWSELSLGPAFFAMIMSFPAPAEESIRRQLFESIYYKRADMANPMSLHGDEENAFRGLDPMDVYRVFGRAIAVNFTRSLSALKPLSGFALRFIESLRPSESPHSSPGPSAPD